MVRANLRQVLAAVCVMAALSAVPRTADAHGIWGHVHVTAWAITNLPPGELRDFFSEPEVFNAALFGAAYTDSGYWPQGGELGMRSRVYGEHTHWEPYVQDFVAWIRDNDPPPWDDLESRKRVAFLMGNAAHGLQDEIFDSLFLYQVEEHDDGEQDVADPGTDGFLALDDQIRFFPEEYMPMSTLLELYADLPQTITRDVIQRSVDTMTFFYVNASGTITARGLGEQYAEVIPWTRAHYLDPDIPGTLRAEIVPTSRYIRAVWERLHEGVEPSGVVIHAYPHEPWPLRSGDPATVDSWITFVFAAGTDIGSIEASLVDAEGEAVPFRLQGTRWGERWTRLVRLRPLVPLVAGEYYTAAVEPGAQMIDGVEITERYAHTFRVACDESEPCPLDDPAGDDHLDLPQPGAPFDEPDAGAEDVVDDVADEPFEDDVAEDDSGSDVSPPPVEDVGDDVADEPPTVAEEVTVTPPDAADAAAEVDASPSEGSGGGSRGGGGCAATGARGVPTWSLVGLLLAIGARRARRRA